MSLSEKAVRAVVPGAETTSEARNRQLGTRRLDDRLNRTLGMPSVFSYEWRLVAFDPEAASTSWRQFNEGDPFDPHAYAVTWLGAKLVIGATAEDRPRHFLPPRLAVHFLCLGEYPDLSDLASGALDARVIYGAGIPFRSQESLTAARYMMAARLETTE